MACLSNGSIDFRAFNPFNPRLFYYVPTRGHFVNIVVLHEGAWHIPDIIRVKNSMFEVVLQEQFSFYLIFDPILLFNRNQFCNTMSGDEQN